MQASTILSSLNCILNFKNSSEPFKNQQNAWCVRTRMYYKICRLFTFFYLIVFAYRTIYVSTSAVLAYAASRRVINLQALLSKYKMINAELTSLLSNHQTVGTGIQLLQIKTFTLRRSLKQNNLR